MAGFQRGDKLLLFRLFIRYLSVVLGGFLFAACTLSPVVSPTLQPASPLPSAVPVTETPTHPSTPLPIFSLSPTASFTPSLRNSPTAPPTSNVLHLCSPLGGYTFGELPGIESQPFIPPRPGKDDGHHGVDFAHWQYKDRGSLEGAEVQSVLQGIVAASVFDKYPYGNMIIIETLYDQLPQILVTTYQLLPSQSLYLLYAHLKVPSPHLMGETVLCGEAIGIVGNTGASGNPHLHLETRPGPAGVTFTSMEYYKTTSTPEERANYERWRFLGDFILFDPWVLLVLGQ
jgi:murein DD-endopeptidase MepM/ murein hydrolase activator NlpD